MKDVVRYPRLDGGNRVVVGTFDVPAGPGEKTTHKIRVYTGPRKALRAQLLKALADPRSSMAGSVDRLGPER